MSQPFAPGFGPRTIRGKGGKEARRKGWGGQSTVFQTSGRTGCLSQRLMSKGDTGLGLQAAGDMANFTSWPVGQEVVSGLVCSPYRPLMAHLPLFLDTGHSHLFCPRTGNR